MPLVPGFFMRGRMGGMKLLSRQITPPQFDTFAMLLGGLVCALCGLTLFTGDMRMLAILLGVVSLGDAFKLSRELRKHQEQTSTPHAR